MADIIAAVTKIHSAIVTHRGTWMTRISLLPIEGERASRPHSLSVSLGELK